jgi:hypothetical protein
MQRAITRSSLELGVGAVKVLRCSSLRSDPADAGPADLDGADAQLRFGNYAMARLYGHVGLQMVEVDDRFERRYSAVISPVSHDTPSAPHAVHAEHLPVGAPEFRLHAPSQHNVLLMFDQEIWHQTSTRQVHSGAESQ